MKRATGDLLFTDFGVSGNAVFKISDKTHTLNNPVIYVDFVPNIAEKDLYNALIQRKQQAFIPDNDILNGIVHKKLGERIVANSCGNIQKIAKTVKNYSIKIIGTLGFDYAQTTKGGIKTDDVSPDTYESKLQNGLYLTGEILDIDGECGGYNLTFAFVSGIVAAKAVKHKYNING